MTITHLTDEIATQQLSTLERRLHGSTAQILQISERATVIDACVAFAALAETYHPCRYRNVSPPLADRAQRAYLRLEEALEQFIARFPERPTRELAARRRQRAAEEA